MKRFKRRKGAYLAAIEPVEAQILSSLITQFIELLSAADGTPPGDHPVEPTTEPDDPFARWQEEMAAYEAGGQRPEDPVLLRLFPDAYEDPEEAEEFRRFTQSEQRETKLAEAQIVQRIVVSTEDGAHPLRITPEEVGAWLRTINALRLVLSVRLGISNEFPEGDPNPAMPDHQDFMKDLYDWLAFTQEALLSAL